jgi:hypothetical protein
MREHENVDTKHTQGDRRFADSPVEGTGFEPPVPLLRRFCRAVNPDAVMKTEAPKVRSRRRRLPEAPSYSYSARGGTGSSNLPSSTGESNCEPDFGGESRHPLAP